MYSTQTVGTFSKELSVIKRKTRISAEDNDEKAEEEEEDDEKRAKKSKREEKHCSNE